MTSPKRPGVAFWATVVAGLALPILYVASFGPVCWLLQHEAIPESMEGMLDLYEPVANSMTNRRFPAWARDSMIWYVGLWVHEDDL